MSFASLFSSAFKKICINALIGIDTVAGRYVPRPAIRGNGLASDSCERIHIDIFNHRARRRRRRRPFASLETYLAAHSRARRGTAVKSPLLDSGERERLSESLAMRMIRESLTLLMCRKAILPANTAHTLRLPCTDHTS